MRFEKRYVRHRIFFSSCLGAFVVISGLLSGCGVMVKLGLKSPPDIDQRSGPTGTHENPGILNPFEKARLVMAAGECRTFRIRVPREWYVKCLVTVVTRREEGSAYLGVRFLTQGAGWAELHPHKTEQRIYMRGTSSQTMVAISNWSTGSEAFLELCQEGPPLEVTLEMQTSRVVERVLVPQPAPEP